MKEKEENPKSSKPFIGVKFDCCGVYTRVYRNVEDSEYKGRCPKCLKAIRVKVDPKQGVASRFLRAW